VESTRSDWQREGKEILGKRSAEVSDEVGNRDRRARGREVRALRRRKAKRWEGTTSNHYLEVRIRSSKEGYLFRLGIPKEGLSQIEYWSLLE